MIGRKDGDDDVKVRCQGDGTHEHELTSISHWVDEEGTKWLQDRSMPSRTVRQGPIKTTDRVTWRFRCSSCGFDYRWPTPLVAQLVDHALSQGKPYEYTFNPAKLG